MIKNLITYYFFLIISNSCLAQNFPFKNFTTKDGLPTNYVYGIIEDSEGFIWAYTENGISKYDGYEWVNYDTNDGLAGNDVPLAIKNECGDVYFWSYDTQGGAILSNGKINKNEHNYDWISNLNDGIIFYNNPYVYTVDCNGKISEKKNIFKLDITYRFLSVQESYKYDDIKKEIIVTNDSINIPIQSSINNFFDSKHFFEFKKENDKYIVGIENDILHVINISSHSSIEFDIKQRFKEYGDYRKLDYHDGKIYASYSKGLIVTNEKLEILQTIKYDFIPNNVQVRNAFLDSNQNLWIGSRSNGVFFVPKSYRNFKLLSPSQENVQVIVSIHQSKNGKIYAGSDNGISYYVTDSLQMLFKHTNTASIKSLGEYNGDTLIYNSINYKYLIYPNHKIKKFRDLPEFKKIEKIESQNTSLSNKIKLSKSIYITKIKNTIWYTSSSKVSNYLNIDNPKPELNNNKNIFLNCYLLDRVNDTIIVGNNENIIKVVQNKYLEFPTSELKDIVYLKHFKKDKVFIGNNIGKLFIYNLLDHSIKEILDKGIPKDIAIVNDSIAFVSTYNSVYKINIKSDSINILQLINADLGAPFDEVHDILVKDSLLYVGCGQGIAIINFSTPLVETNVFNDYQCILYDRHDSILIKKSLPLIANDLTISHKITHYPSGNKIKYYTKLSPVDLDFKITSDPFTKFQNLNYGSYTFDVYAIDVYGSRYNFNSLNFKIETPFYKTWWFLFALVLILSALLYYINHRNYKAKKNELSILKQLNSLKLSALQSQMNPHFIFNALGAIQYFIQTHDTEKADEYLSDFAKLIRRILESSKVKTVSLEDEIEMLTLYIRLEEARFENLFKTKIDIDENLDLLSQIPPMLIQPFVENAINHGLYNLKERQGELLISFEQNVNGGLICTIFDNGIGIKAAKAIKKIKGHKSRGIQLIDEKINALKKAKEFDISLTTQNLNVGTRIIIKIQSI